MRLEIVTQRIAQCRYKSRKCYFLDLITIKNGVKSIKNLFNSYNYDEVLKYKTQLIKE